MLQVHESFLPFSDHRFYRQAREPHHVSSFTVGYLPDKLQKIVDECAVTAQLLLYRQLPPENYRGHRTIPAPFPSGSNRNGKKRFNKLLVDTVTTFRDAAFRKLATVQQLKKSAIEDHFGAMRGQLSTLSHDPLVQKAFSEFDRTFKFFGKKTDNSTWQSLAKKYDKKLKPLAEENGWPDLYLIHASGDILYSVGRASDLAGNIPSSNLANSSLGQAFVEGLAMKAGAIAAGDFAPYPPAGGEPAAFMLAQIRDTWGALKGFVAIRVPTQKLSAIAGQREGMGISGNSFLVGKAGGIISYRSDLPESAEGVAIGNPARADYMERSLEGKRGRRFTRTRRAT